MSLRNLTELFQMLRNKAVHSRNVCYHNNSDLETLLEPSRKSTSSPGWIGNYDEVQFFISKIQERINEVRKNKSDEVRAVLSDGSYTNMITTEKFMVEIQQLICCCHDSINCFSRPCHGLEKMLLQNMQMFCFMLLQTLSEQFRLLLANNTSDLIKQTDEVLNTGGNVQRLKTLRNSVDTFDNFLQHEPLSEEQAGITTVPLPATGLTINQKQIILIQADNTKMLKNHEDDVLRMTNSISELNVIFKDVLKLIQEQGTVLDRIDFNIESAQVRVNDGLHQLQKSETYQRKNHKIICILLLALVIMFMIILTIFTKF